MRPVDATVANLALLLVGPTPARNVLAGKVDDDIEAVQTSGADLVLIGMPFNFSGFRRWANQTGNFVSITFQNRNPSRDDQSSRASDRNLHSIGLLSIAVPTSTMVG